VGRITPRHKWGGNPRHLSPMMSAGASNSRAWLLKECQERFFEERGVTVLGRDALLGHSELGGPVS